MEEDPDNAALEQATAPARWLLDAGRDGVPLTQTYALARVVVREAVERWPDWWAGELFGPPHREADVAVLADLHEGLRRLKLMRRRGRALYPTPRGRQLVADPVALLQVLTADLGGGDAFTEMVAEAVLARLSGPPCGYEDLVAPALRRARQGGWRGPEGEVPDERKLSWVVGDVLCRGEAYGVIRQEPDHSQPRVGRRRFALTAAARSAAGLDHASSRGTSAVLVFDAVLISGLAVDVRGVSARVAVRADQHLTALHDALQEAFGWLDDHLYSFWLDGRFWGDHAVAYTSPFTLDGPPQTAEVPIVTLELAVGATLAYVFDFGDEWRARLTLEEQVDADGGTYPRVLDREGTAPPQYPDLDDVK